MGGEETEEPQTVSCAAAGEHFRRDAGSQRSSDQPKSVMQRCHRIRLKIACFHRSRCFLPIAMLNPRVLAVGVAN